MTRIEKGPGWELRLGDYREVLADVSGGALLADCPFSKVTHKGHDEGSDIANRKSTTHRRPSDGLVVKARRRRKLGYTPWTAEDVRECVAFFGPRVSGWMVSITDHVLEPEWHAAYKELGRYVFDFPIPWFAPGSRVRQRGDGPACWTCPIAVSRPRTAKAARWRALPGGYVHQQDRGSHGGNEGVVVGSKPLALMLDLVRDYTRPGELVIDPCAGGGTTLLAAVMEGRQAIGAERDPATFELAVQRLRRPFTPVLFDTQAIPMRQLRMVDLDPPEPAAEESAAEEHAPACDCGCSPAKPHCQRCGQRLCDGERPCACVDGRFEAPPRECSCLGECRGAEGIAPGWRCALEAHREEVAACVG